MLIFRLLRLEWSVAGAKIPANIFIVQIGLATHELTCMLDSLVRVSRRGEWNHVITEQHINKLDRHVHPPWDRPPYAYCCRRPACWHWLVRQETQHTFCSRPVAALFIATGKRICARQSHQKDIGCFHFPFSKFRHCYLSLQSPVSSFPHGTCLLLVSNIYSALDEVYHPLHAPIPRNMTLRKHTVHWELQMTHRIVTLVNALFQGLIAAPQLVIYLNPTIQNNCFDFQIEHVLMHSPLLKESLWVSHPPPTYMLKFSGLAGLSSCFGKCKWPSIDLVSLTQATCMHQSICPRMDANCKWTSYLLHVSKAN